MRITKGTESNQHTVEHYMIRLVVIMTGAPFVAYHSDLTKPSKQEELAGAARFQKALSGVAFDFAIAPESQPYNDIASIVGNIEADSVEHLDDFYYDIRSSRGDTIRSLEKKIAAKMKKGEPTTLDYCLRLAGGRSIESQGESAWEYASQELLALHKPRVALIVGPRITAAALAYAAIGAAKSRFSSVVRNIDFLQHDIVDIEFTELPDKKSHDIEITWGEVKKVKVGGVMALNEA